MKRNLTAKEREQIEKIKKRNKTPWKIVDSRYSEITFLLGLVDRAYCE